MVGKRGCRSFNMPKAKVFMGDVGSVLLGFVYAGGTAAVYPVHFQGIRCIRETALPFTCGTLEMKGCIGFLYVRETIVQLDNTP